MLHLSFLNVKQLGVLSTTDTLGQNKVAGVKRFEKKRINRRKLESNSPALCAGKEAVIER